MSAATPVRKDPKPRVYNGEVRGPKLLNRDPKKAYVYVNPADPDAYGLYQSMGYEVERQTEAGVKLAIGATSKNGEAIAYQGQILMSVSLERKAEIDQFGPEGDTGTAWADQLESRFVDKDRLAGDLMRGVNSRYSRAAAEISSSRGV